MPCSYCSCNPETDSLEQAIKSLLGCNNGSVNIEMEGQWTGYGQKAILQLAERWGKANVYQEVLRQQELKEK